MENKNWIIGLIVIIIIVGLAIWGYSKNKPAVNTGVKGETQATEITGTENYFDANAKVIYFYQPTCYYCLLESPILSDLATEGYRVKPMDAAKDATVWAQSNPNGPYKINGTPIFIAANGDRLEGMQTKDALKAFLDAHR